MLVASLSLLATLVSAAVAQSSSANPFKVNGPIQVTAGKPYTLEWNPTTQGPVSLTLRSGASSDLKDVKEIASSIPNSGKYTFTLPSSTTRNSDYSIQIAPVGKPDQANYTPQFVVESSNTVESDSTSATSATTSGKSTSTNTKSTASKTSTGSSSSAAASSTSGSSASAAATTAESAPTSGASINNVLNVQGGLAAALAGAAMLI